jgi:hypothetical protein
VRAQVSYDEQTHLTEVELRAPIVVLNTLPFPIELTVERAVNAENTKYFADDLSGWDPADWDQLRAERPELRVKSEVRKKTNVERGFLEPRAAWNIHGGGAFAPGNISLVVHERPNARLDGLASSRIISLTDTAALEAGWTLKDGRTDRILRVLVKDTVTNAEENKHSRNLRFFCHYVFVDCSGLQLRFTEDELSYMTSVHRPADRGHVRNAYIAFSSLVERTQRRIKLGTPYCSRWSQEVVIPAFEPAAHPHLGGDLEMFNMHTVYPVDGRVPNRPGAEGRRVESMDLLALSELPKRADVSERASHHVVRVPATVRFSTRSATGEGEANSDLEDHFSVEVVLTVTYPFGQVGPANVTCRPRLHVVNNLQCGLVARQFSAVEDGTNQLVVRDRELPLYLPCRSAAPLHFWDRYYNMLLEEHPPLADIQELSFRPDFSGALPDAMEPLRNSSWEWSGPVSVVKSGTYIISVHNTSLNRRMLLRLEVCGVASELAVHGRHSAHRVPLRARRSSWTGCTAKCACPLRTPPTLSSKSRTTPPRVPSCSRRRRTTVRPPVAARATGRRCGRARPKICSAQPGGSRALPSRPLANHPARLAASRGTLSAPRRSACPRAGRTCRMWTARAL